MSFTAQAESPPIHEDADGAVRVGSSRVLLELVVRAFQDGATPEAIVQRYATLSLGDVYAVVGYYLRHGAEIDEYLARREHQAGEMRKRMERDTADLTAIRARLAARRRA